MSVLMVADQEVLEEGQAPKTYRKLFSRCFVGVGGIQLSEPYLRQNYQIENLRSFIDLFDGPIKIKLTTTESTGRNNEFTLIEQEKNLNKIVDYAREKGIVFSYQYDNNEHVRKIVTDTGWIIKSDRGLDIYNPDGFHRKTEIDYIRREQQTVIKFADLPMGKNMIRIENITQSDAARRKIRILSANTFLFPPSRDNRRTVYTLLVKYNGQNFDATYTVGSNDGRRRSPVLKLYRELFDSIGIEAGTVLVITRGQDNIFTIEK